LGELPASKALEATRGMLGRSVKESKEKMEKRDRRA
jgi:hypothetical protein